MPFTSNETFRQIFQSSVEAIIMVDKDGRILLANPVSEQMFGYAGGDLVGNLIEDRTVIVIAHRLSTIRRADKIVVLDRGRVAEVGSHEDLINKGGIYQRLHEMQFLEADPVVNT